MQVHPEQTIEFFPFTCQPDSDGFIVGRPETATFIALPEEGVRILGWLQSGKTVRETSEMYEKTYGESPDLHDFLEVIAESGFIKLPPEPDTDHADDQAGQAKKSRPQQPQLVQYHMKWLSDSLARTLFSKQALLFYALLAAAAITTIILNPGIFPSRSDMVFETNTSVFFISFLLFQLSSVMLHEMGHLAAARSKGVQARFGFGNRLWIIVAETDLTGIWSLPRRDRMLPLLGGPLVDVFLLSCGTFLLYALEYGLITMPGQLAQFARGMYLFLCFRLLWQCYFFVRTDFYYVFTTTFECKNLLMDTQAFVTNKFKQIFGFGEQADLSAISDREMRVIRAYSWVYIFGRVLAIFVLIFYLLPILWSYMVIFYQSFAGASDGDVAPMLDSLIVISISCAIYGIGFAMWGRSIFKKFTLRGSKA